MKAIPFLVSAVLALSIPAQAQEKATLTLTKTVPLPEIQGGFNHISSDIEHGRVFATATTKKTLEIIDVKSGKPWRSLAGDRPVSTLFAPEFNQLYVTRSNKVCIYDGSTFDLVTAVELPSSLDEMGYDPNAKRLYVGCMSSANPAIAIVSIPDGKLKGEIKLPAKPQGFVVEQKGNRIFVNTPSVNQVTVVDREKRTALDPWPLKGTSGNCPIALDETNHRLFVGCRQPPQLVVFDTTSGKSVASVAICGGTDDMSYDPRHKRVYIACTEGFVDVVEQRDANHYELRDHISTPPGSRNSVLSTDSTQFYLAVPQRENQGAEIRVFEPRN